MAKKNPEDVRLTTEQLAEMWGMTADHLEVWRMRGKGPKFIKLGDDPRAPVRYRMSDILEYEKIRTRSSTKPKK